MEFVRRVHEQFEFDPDVNPAEAIRDVKSNMPKDIQEWFPEEVAPGG